MTSKAFFWAAVLAVILGGALGGILIVALDGSKEETPVVSTLAGPPAGGSATERLEELASRIESGEADAEDLEELEEIVSELPDGLPAGDAASGTPGGGAGGDVGRMIGTVESFEGGVLAVNSPIGPLETNVGDETVITAISEVKGTLDDLTAGLQVTLEGERNEEGVLEAASITVVPESFNIPLGGRFAGGQGFPQGFAGIGGAPPGLSEQELAALSMQAAIMAAQAGRGGGNVTVESPEEGVTIITETRPAAGDGGGAPIAPPENVAGMPDDLDFVVGSITIPGETRVFSFQVPGQEDGALGSELTGVIESVEDGAVVLTTQRGPIRSSIGEETDITIYSQSDGSLDDLVPGAQVVMTGNPDDAGLAQATAITVLPESLSLPIGRGFGGRQGGGAGGFGRGQGGLGGDRP